MLHLLNKENRTTNNYNDENNYKIETGCPGVCSKNCAFNCGQRCTTLVAHA